jgi:hypothetical protein
MIGCSNIILIGDTYMIIQYIHININMVHLYYQCQINIIFFSNGTGVWTKSTVTAIQAFYHLNHAQAWVYHCLSNVIHIWIVTTLGISLYNYLYLKLLKMICFSYYLSWFLFNKVEEQERFCPEAEWVGVGTNNVYTCK